MKSTITFLAAALGLLGAFAQESTMLALPGQAEGSAIGPAEARRRATHESLRRPFVMCYYVEPTILLGETARIAYYVTDWEHSKVRFGDTSKRFSVSLEWSTDGQNWKRADQKDVASGDGTFDLQGLARGDYVFRIVASDSKGRPSRTVWGEFRVRTKDELEIKPSEIARPTLADLAARGIQTEADDFYVIQPVELGDIQPMRNFRDQITYNEPKRAADKEALEKAIAAKVAEAIESEEGRRLVAAHEDGHLRIRRDLCEKILLQRLKGGGDVVEVDLVRGVHGDRGGLVVLGGEGVRLRARKYDGDALLEGRHRDDERHQKKEGEVDQGGHVDLRLRAFAASVSVAAAHQASLPWNSRAMRPLPRGMGSKLSTSLLVA